MLSRVLLIGLDALEPSLVRRWTASGDLPNLAYLMATGSWGPLRSVPNMCSAAAWPSMVTGVNPGKHGIFWFAEPIPGKHAFAYANASRMHALPLWRRLSAQGKRVVVLNVPITFPAEPVNGVLIAGMDCPDVTSRGFAYPPKVGEELLARFRGYIITSGTPDYIASGRMEEGINRLNHQIANRLAAARFLLEYQPWDFAMVVFTAADNAQHAFWKYMDPTHPDHVEFEASRYGHVIADVYQRLDAAVGELLKLVDNETCVLIASDHGAGLNQRGANYLNQWLAEEGFLTFQDSEWDPRGIRQYVNRLIIRTAAATYSWMRSTLPRSALNLLARSLPAVRSVVEARVHYAQIDWSQTKAYSDGATDCIRLNLADREPEGIVQPGAEYERIRDQIIERLATAYDPTDGRRVVTRAYRREEVYHGPFVEQAPDIGIEWNMEAVIQGMTSGDKQQDQSHFRTKVDRWNGGHRPLGTLIMQGPGIQAGVELPEQLIWDIAPMVLYLMGQTVPVEMDGQVIEAAIRPEVLAHRPVVIRADDIDDGSEHPEQLLTEDEAELVEQRLRALGYIA